VTFHLRHPSEPHTYATYGFDPVKRGYWAEVRDEPHVVRTSSPTTGADVEIDMPGWLRATYDITQPAYNTVEPVWGLLEFLASEGFFALSDVIKAMRVIEHQGLEGLPQRLRAIGEIVANLDLGLG